MPQQFNFGHNIRGSASAQDLARLAQILQRNLGAGFGGLLGGRVNSPDLRRLLEFGLNKQNRQFVLGILDAANKFKLANLPKPDARLPNPKPPFQKQPPPGPAPPPGPGGHGGGPSPGGSPGGVDGGHGFGGPPGNFSSRGQPIPPPFQTPQSPQINNLFTALLNGIQRQPREIKTLPPELLAALQASFQKLLGTNPDALLNQDLVSQAQNTINQLLESPGLPEEVLRNAQNRVREGLATRERSLLQRRGDLAASRNAFGSGPQVRALEGIERDVSQELANQLTNISLEDARAAERARALGLQSSQGLNNLLLQAQQVAGGLQSAGQQGVLGLGNLNLASQSTAIQEALQRQGLDLKALQLAISRELGLADVDIRQSQLELQRQLEEFMRNLFLQSNFFGNPLAEDGSGGGGFLPNFNFNFGGAGVGGGNQDRGRNFPF